MELFYIYYDLPDLKMRKILSDYKHGIYEISCGDGKIAFFDQDVFESAKEHLDELSIEYSE